MLQSDASERETIPGYWGFKSSKLRNLISLKKLSQPQRQHNLNTVVGLDTKMTLHTTPPQKLNGSLREPQINIY